MKPGNRIRLTETCPWPERVGLLGVIATPPDDYGDIYPVHGLGRGEVIVLLDEDPFDHPPIARWWTCVLSRRSVEVVRQRQSTWEVDGGE